MAIKLTTEEHSRVNAVSCPFCFAQPLKPCVTRNVTRKGIVCNFHWARIRKALNN